MSFYGLDDHMDFGSLRVRNDVAARDNLGRFTEQMRERNRRAITSAVERGAEVARSAAPKKTGDLAASIRWSLVPGNFTTAPKTGTWEVGEIRVGTGHWRFVVFGTRPHEITGMVRFFWEKEARMWHPGHNYIHHPGTNSVPFMDMAFEAAKDELRAAMHREYSL